MDFEEHHPYNQLIDSQIEQIIREFKKLRQKIEILTEENERLKKELNLLKESSHGLQNEKLSDAQRLAMRQQINGLIDKIDRYLGES